MYKNMPLTTDPSISAHITWTEIKNGPITLRGYAIDTDSGIRKDYSKERKRVAKSIEEIPARQQHLYKAICDDVERNERKTTVKVTTTVPKSPLVLAFEALETSPDPVSSDWGIDYTRKKMSYFRRNILPILTADAGDWDNDKLGELQKAIVEKILKSGNSAGHEPTAAATASKSLSAADIIYQRMRDYDDSLPVLSLAPRFTGRHGKNEKIKSLPRPVRRKFVKLLEAFVDENPRLAMAIIAMYDNGLRTAEAAAVWIDVILRTANVTCIFVCYQIKDGHRSKLLKTKNAYRLVPATTWGTVMLDRCRSKLSDDPNDEANWICDTRLLSSTIKKMLLEAGLTEDYFAAAEKAMREKPDYDEAGRPIFDVAAYILRRDWASRARNVCGFTPLEIDYSLGHDVKIPKRKRDDLRHLCNQEKLAAKLERYVHNPQHSKHPGCTPYSVQHSSELELMPYDIIRIVNTSDECLSVKLDTEAVVNTDSIIVIAPENSQTSSTTRFLSTHCKRISEPIIGKSYIKEDGTLEHL